MEHVAGAAVAQVGHRGQRSEYRDPGEPGGVEGQAAVVAQQHCRRGGGLARQIPMLGAADHRAVGAGGEHPGEAQERGERLGHPGVHVGDVELSGGHGLGQHRGALLAERHLDVAAGLHRGHRVAQTHDEVGDHKTVPAPVLAQDLGEQRAAVAAPVAVERVVGAHHRGHSVCGHPLEVGQVHLVQGPLVGGDVHLEAGVLHRVAGEVLHARHHVALQAPGEGGGHLAHMAGILAVGLLGAAPGGVAQQVHAHRAGEGCPRGPQLGADRLADALLECGVERRAPGHRHRERGGRSQHASPGAVGEVEPGNAQALDAGRGPSVGVVAAAHQVGDAGPERRLAVEAAELLLQGHHRHELIGLGPGVSTLRHPVGGLVEGGHASTLNRVLP